MTDNRSQNNAVTPDLELVTKYDPRDLIKDALALEGLYVEEYRSIFFDWAFGHKGDIDLKEAAQAMLNHYQSHTDPAHPMLELLREAVEGQAEHGRRGLRSTRRRKPE